MSSREHVILPELSQPANLQPPRGAAIDPARLRARKLFDQAIFLFLCLFAVLLPHSVKGSQHAWKIAFLLWLIALIVRGERPLPQRLAAPLLAYLALTGISTALSPDPYMSWDRMKIVCLVLVGVVVAQNLHRLRQVRTLVYLLILSGVAAAAFTAWQYSYGIGVRIANVAPDAPLAQRHVVPDDIITHVNGRQTHAPAELEQIVRSAPAGSMLHLEFIRSSPYHRREAFLTREQMLQSGLGTSALPLTRGKPLRAQGTLGHYVVLAEILMQIACMAWALMLVTNPQRRGLRLALCGAFVAIVGALCLTGTRAALAGLALGGLLAAYAVASKKSRRWAIAALVVMVMVGLLWFRHARGPHWMGTHDDGTSFRIMMWEDSVHLIRQHPWFGLGMETIRNHWMEWHVRAFGQFHDQTHFHNDFIQLAVERGIPAMLAWLWFCVAYTVFLVRLIRRARKRSKFATGVATGVLAAFAAYQIVSLVHYDLGIESVAMLLFCFYGIAIAVDRMLQTPGAFDVA